MSDTAYKLADEKIVAVLSSTGVLSVDSSSLLGSDLVKKQLEASEKLRLFYKDKKPSATDESSDS